MNDPHAADVSPRGEGPEEMRSALFAHLVMQQSSMAMMLLGKTAHPETGKIGRDLEAAKLFIDLLEMLEVKTKGNLNHEEDSLLKQNLMSLRMAFVEAVDAPRPQPEAQPERDSAPAGSVPAPDAASGTAPTEEEHRKKFSKKY